LFLLTKITSKQLKQKKTKENIQEKSQNSVGNFCFADLKKAAIAVWGRIFLEKKKFPQKFPLFGEIGQ